MRMRLIRAMAGVVLCAAPLAAYAGVLGGDDADARTVEVPVSVLSQDVGIDLTRRIAEIIRYLSNSGPNRISLPPEVREGVPSSYDEVADAVFGEVREYARSDARVYATDRETACVFARDWSLGDSDPDVRRVQTFLNAQGFIVAESGPGSPGNETEYFGARTHAAVWRFQDAYRDDILAPLGLLHATGFWGSATRAKANELSGCRAR